MYFQSEDNHETMIAKRGKVLKNYSFKLALKMTFLFNFLHETEEVETLVKNSGANSHPWQLQKKI